jgi:hypothetical protein
LPALVDDEGYDTLEIVAQINRSEPESCDAVFRNESIPSDVAQRIRTEFMREAVNLDGDSRFVAKEVEDERAERMLAAEFESVRTALQNIPETSFRWSHALAK